MSGFEKESFNVDPESRRLHNEFEFLDPDLQTDLQALPPMPLGDGAFFQPGALTLHGTEYVDGADNPIHGRRPAKGEAAREMAALEAWIYEHFEDK